VATRGRYPTDLTDKQWNLIKDLVPAIKPGGRPELHSRREIVNAILYLTRTGCAWRMLPKDMSPWQTVYMYFATWRDDGTVAKIHDALREQVRVRSRGRQGGHRDAKPTAGIVESQALRGADTAGADTRGFDAGKRVNGRKRHIVVDTLGMLLVIVVTAASTQDRDGGETALGLLRKALPSVPTSSPTGAMPVGWRPRRRRRSRSLWRSWPSPPTRRASPCCPVDGWSRGPSPG